MSTTATTAAHKMAIREHYDVIVIGSGPGGEGAAMTAVKSGRRVAVIDECAEVGGSCMHRGTIPSKALRHAIQSGLPTTTAARNRIIPT